MLTLNTNDLTPVQIQSYLNHAVAPRPICLASTVDKDGNVNLSPFSFFNLFSVNPPVCVFSPSRRVRDNTTKHTLENIKEVPECVINIVNYDMVQQVSLSSVEYPAGVNEFIKAGLTELPSTMVKPPRVAESKIQLECVVREVISLGDTPGAGNLVIAEVKVIHINEDILNADGSIDQHKTDQVARLGGDWYCRVTADSLFKVAKPVSTIGIGVDAIPYAILNSKVLTGNNLGQLGNVVALPTDDAIEAYSQSDELKEIFDATIGDSQTRDLQLHLKAKQLLDEGSVEEAWMVLLM
ncbi:MULTISPECIES: flavin reductase family protein [unclassified Mucilaginibacter]|uniref:flavin reductase family protein n=1 Tax=unclassified Mucilaginibacter TaxID=2617802 RepID=UPI002AC97176|nr:MULTISPECIES: flavin reductase family protein [unclassified Mucilaginibacter]MEB0262544.1 flavin reductase family protein [Mucilaginibacter sp. 10I4]MEB0277967.1 flavin reductase family protein [Mucilaginibacter sp. 10B2]MEB0299680.1 flavin reductase family protein [Mucilaginibacter sp. 5C4]WPX22858.1 flavin reductase family protein [Mucilaginibacter sp. 5C4]